jgi:hypothetical protein
MLSDGAGIFFCRDERGRSALCVLICRSDKIGRQFCSPGGGKSSDGEENIPDVRFFSLTAIKIEPVFSVR